MNAKVKHSFFSILVFLMMPGVVYAQNLGVDTAGNWLVDFFREWALWILILVIMAAGALFYFQKITMKFLTNIIIGSFLIFGAPAIALIVYGWFA